MSHLPDRSRIDAELEELGIASTSDTRRLISLLATEPRALYHALSRLSELHEPDEEALPPVDRLVRDYFDKNFEHCTEPAVLVKSKPMSTQCKRLLAVLVRDVGTPVPLAELLLVNGLRSATPRRLRELETEHGAFRMRTYSRDRVQHYVLEDANPNVEKCARYWIKANLRASRMIPPRRALALLSAFAGSSVTRRELDYILPEESSPGHGLARAASGLADHAIAELRTRGHSIAEAEGGYVLSISESRGD